MLDFVGQGKATRALLVFAAMWLSCAVACTTAPASRAHSNGGADQPPEDRPWSSEPPSADAALDAPISTDASLEPAPHADAADVVDTAAPPATSGASAAADAGAIDAPSAQDAAVVATMTDAATPVVLDDAAVADADAAADAADPSDPEPQCPDGSEPTRELCDDVDNDCDGTVDEGQNPCGGVCFLDDVPGTPCDGIDADGCFDDVIECVGRNQTQCSIGDEGGICSRTEALPMLTEVADAAGLVASYVPHPDVPVSIAYWNGGIAVGDFDRDGDPDVFMVSGGTRPDYLFINQGSGQFVDHAAAWGLTDVHAGNGATAGDYDGDGLLDLYVTSYGPADAVGFPGHNRLYRNLGGRFENVALAAGVATVSSTSPWATGAAFGDYDLDGDLDLAVTTYASRVGGTRLFRNAGDGSFHDVTADAIGESSLSAVLGFSPRFVDMDADGFPELLITGDYGTSRYLANQRDGSFVDVTVAAGLGLDGFGMGHTVLDLDRDARLDWYVTSLYWSSGWTPPGKLNGNVLYRQLAPHRFEVATQSGTHDGGAAWGAIAVDLDHDGWQDIISVAQGTSSVGYTRVFQNRSAGLFEEVHEAAGLHARDGRNVVTLDADLDGDQDVLITRNGSPLTAVLLEPPDPVQSALRGKLAFYRNDTPHTGHYLVVELDTQGNPELAPDGFGARIEARFGETTLVRVMDGSPSYLGSSEPVAHFGLGAATIVPELRIRWGSSYESVLRDVAADQRLLVHAPSPP